MESETLFAGILGEVSPEVEEISTLGKNVQETFQKFSDIVDRQLKEIAATGEEITKMKDSRILSEDKKYIKQTTSDIENYKKRVTSEFKDFTALHSKILNDYCRENLSQEEAQFQENVTDQNEGFLSQQARSSLKPLRSAAFSFAIFCVNLMRGMICFPFSTETPQPIILAEIDTELENIVLKVSKINNRRKTLKRKEKRVNIENDEIPAKRPHLLEPETTITTEFEVSNTESQVNVQTQSSETPIDVSTTEIADSENHSNVTTETCDAPIDHSTAEIANSEHESNVTTETCDAPIDHSTAEIANSEHESNVKTETCDIPIELSTAEIANSEHESNVKIETCATPIDLTTTNIAGYENESDVKTETSETAINLLNHGAIPELIDLTDEN